MSPKYLPMVWQILEERRRRSTRWARSRSCRRCGARCPRPAKTARRLRAKCVEMRDFVVRIRNHTAMQFAAPVVRGLARRIAAAAELEAARSSTRTAGISTRKALRNDTDPPPEVPRDPAISRPAPGGGVRAGPRSRRRLAPAIPIWWCPPPSARATRPRSRASLRSFPDAFYVSERGRYFPDDSRGQGPPAERRLSQRDGLLPRRHAAHGTDPRREGAEGARPALGRVRLHRRLHGAHLGPVLLQSERRSAGQGRRIRHAAAVR